MEYHVDRSNQLEIGDTINLQDEPFVNPQERAVPDVIGTDAIDEEYPEDLSRHGSRYAFLRVGRNGSVPDQFNDETTPFIGVIELENFETGECRQATSDPSNDDPTWELLMQPPVEIVGNID